MKKKTFKFQTKNKNHQTQKTQKHSNRTHNASRKQRRPDIQHNQEFRVCKMYFIQRKMQKQKIVNKFYCV